jgi:hypothetical protein
MPEKTQNDWTNFIKKKLPDKLRRDLVSQRMFKESDLHSCCYFHLRKFGYGDKKWKILNEPYIADLKGNPDLLIYEGERPKIMLELKFWTPGKSGAGRRDEEKLKHAVKNKKWAQKAFLIEVVLDAKRSTGYDANVPYRSRVITIELPEKGSKKHTEYMDARAVFRKPKRST